MMRYTPLRRLAAAGGWNASFLRAVNATATAAKRQALLHVARGGLDELACAIDDDGMHLDDVGRILGTNVALLSSTKAWHLASPSHALHLVDAFVRYAIPIDDIVAAAMLPALGNMMPLFTSVEVARVLRALHRLRVPLPAPLLIGALSVLSVPASLDVWLLHTAAEQVLLSGVTLDDDEEDRRGFEPTLLLDGLRTLYVVADHGRVALSSPELPAHSDTLRAFVHFALEKVIHVWTDGCVQLPHASEAIGAAIEIGLMCMELLHQFARNGDTDQLKKSVQEQLLALISRRLAAADERRRSSGPHVDLGVAWLIRVLNTAPYWISEYRAPVLSACAQHYQTMLQRTEPSAGSLLRLLVAAARAEAEAHGEPDSSVVILRVGGRTSAYSYAGLLAALASALQSKKPKVNKASAAAVLNGLQVLSARRGGSLSDTPPPPLTFWTWDASRLQLTAALFVRLASLLIDDATDDLALQVAAVLATQQPPSAAQGDLGHHQDLVVEWWRCRTQLVDACFASLFVALSSVPQPTHANLVDTAMAGRFVQEIIALDDTAAATGGMVLAKARSRLERLCVGRADDEEVLLSPSCCWPARPGGSTSKRVTVGFLKQLVLDDATGDVAEPK